MIILKLKLNNEKKKNNPFIFFYLYIFFFLFNHILHHSINLYNLFDIIIMVIE